MLKGHPVNRGRVCLRSTDTRRVYVVLKCVGFISTKNDFFQNVFEIQKESFLSLSRVLGRPPEQFLHEPKQSFQEKSGSFQEKFVRSGSVPPGRNLEPFRSNFCLGPVLGPPDTALCGIRGQTPSIDHGHVEFGCTSWKT